MRLEPLGDQAVMVYCDNEAHASAVAAHVRAAKPNWCLDVVQAYVSVAVYYDLAVTDFATAADWLGQLNISNTSAAAGRLHDIPCCYNLGLDFERIEKHTGLARAQIISLHSNTEYTVYAIGFCPGFPYLGYLPENLSAVPRLESPRLKVESG